MFTLIAALLASPIVLVDACDESGFPITSLAACRASCGWWSCAERRCRDSDVEELGAWDPRPALRDWSAGYSMPNPPEWGTYRLEKENVQP